MVSDMKLWRHRSFLFALQFTISQPGIAAQTLTLMQGSKEKEKKYRNVIVPNRETSQAHSV